MKSVLLHDWFSNCGGFSAELDVGLLRGGAKAGLLNEQDEYGMTALMLAVMSKWQQGAEELLAAGANTELRFFRTGETALMLAVEERNESLITALIAAGANPDAANYWGVTSRIKAKVFGLDGLLSKVPENAIAFPTCSIQNAEHLADHHHPQFEIPDRKEREELQPGQAVGLYVYGPKSEAKQDTVKVRITKRTSTPAGVAYLATIETPLERTHLAANTTEVEFGPEHVATVYVARPKK